MWMQYAPCPSKYKAQGMFGPVAFVLYRGERPEHPTGYKMTLDEIEKLSTGTCPRFATFAREQLPMPGIKKYLNDILNREILVTDFRITKSKHREGTECMQFQFKMDGVVCVAFTGSVVLIDQIQSARDSGKMPFVGTIVKIDKYFSFS